MRRQPASRCFCPSLWLLSSLGACVTKIVRFPNPLATFRAVGEPDKSPMDKPLLHCHLLITIAFNHLLFGKTAKQQISDGGGAQALHPPSCPPSSHFQGSGTVKRWFRRRSRRRSGCCERVLQLQLSSWQLLPASLLPPACLAWPALGPSVCHGAQQLVRPLTQLRSTQPRHF